MEKTLKVLFLTAWYPQRYDAMEGLFVRKHAEAVSRHANVCVLYLHADERIRNFEVVEQTFGDVREIYVYYPFSKQPLFHKTSKLINYIRAFRMGYKHVAPTFGGTQPDICQANVLTRTGVLAYWLQLRHHIPYVIAEHWSRYLPQNFSFNGFFHRLATKIVVRHARCVMPVSQALQNAMQQCGLHNPNYRLLNNVVDDFFYIRQPAEPRNRKRILHVSCFDNRAKNLTGLLRAVKQVAGKRNDFELVIIGTGADYEQIAQYAQEIGLHDDTVKFLGELPPTEVCHWLYNSDFMLMFSNYENAPVVISEALATGTPIVSSNAGGIPEMIPEKAGILVPAQDESALVAAINRMLDEHGNYPTAEIMELGKKYSYSAVGRQLMEVYKQALNQKD